MEIIRTNDQIIEILNKLHREYSPWHLPRTFPEEMISSLGNLENKTVFYGDKSKNSFLVQIEFYDFSF